MNFLNKKDNVTDNDTNFIDNSPEALEAQLLQESANNSAEVFELQQLQYAANNGIEALETQQLQEAASNTPQFIADKKMQETADKTNSIDQEISNNSATIGQKVKGFFKKLWS